MIKTRKQIILSAFFFIIATNNPSQILCNDSDTTIEQQFDLTLPAAPESSTRKNRMRKSSTPKKKTKKTLTYMEMEYEELVIAKNKQKEKGNIPSAIKYIEQMLKLSSDITLAAEHLLELADLFYIDSQFQKAAIVYSQYCALYPGSAQQEYALYQSIASSFACILPIDRDQTKTEETLTLTEQFLKQDHFITHKEDVTEIQTQCHEQLAASECNICNFYLTSGKLSAAEKRLNKIRSNWLPKLPTLEPEIIALENQLLEQKEMVELLKLSKTELAQKRVKKNNELAQNKKSNHMSNRF